MKLNNLNKRISLFLKSPKMLKDSATFAFALLAVIETIMSVAAVSLNCINNWWIRLLLIAIVYCILAITAFLLKFLHAKKGITISVRGIPVTIKQGDLFKSEGWKVISFTNRYDTKVDDILINKNSINGIFIEQYIGIDNLDKLQQIISSDDDESHTLYKKYKEGRYWSYPLGRIKLYQDYMLLAFAKINEQNEVHTSHAAYEQCLRVMWKEISRTYANKPIVLPLLGSGVLRFDDWSEKSNKELLKCMICTLRTSGLHINQPITILLTEKIFQELNLYELK